MRLQIYRVLNMNKEYIASEYRKMHEAKKFNGDSLGMHIPEIKKLIKLYDCKTILDYGCGKAKVHKKEKLGDVTLYDPYYEPHSKPPQGTFDMVICTDVLEHVPFDEVSQTLENLMGHADKVLFLVISTKPAKKKFTNGENVHLTVRPESWWDAMLISSIDRKILTGNLTVVKHYT